MVAAMTGLGIFAADPQVALSENEVNQELTISDNVEDQTEGFGILSTLAKVFHAIEPVGKYIYALPYLVSMMFGTEGAMGIVIAGLVTLLSFMYIWLIIELTRGMKT
jgi:hypothetical protein